jgi:hypothetical protein
MYRPGSAAFEQCKAGTNGNVEVGVLIAILEATRQANYTNHALISKLWKVAAEFGSPGYANLPEWRRESVKLNYFLRLWVSKGDRRRNRGSHHRWKVEKSQPAPVFQ